MEYIAFDAHKRYTLASVERADGHRLREERIPHERGCCVSSWRAASADRQWRSRPGGRVCAPPRTRPQGES